MNIENNKTWRKNIMKNSGKTIGIVILLVMVGLLVSPMSALAGEDHAHASPHGGIVKTMGDFHLELGFQPAFKGFQCPMKEHKVMVHDKPGNCPSCGMKLVPHESGLLEVYFLGENEKEAKTLSAKEVIAQVKIENGEQFQAVTLTPQPLKGEKQDATSHYAGVADFLKNAKAFQAVIRVTIDGKNYRAMFDAKAKDFHATDEHAHKEKHDEENHDQ